MSTTQKQTRSGRPPEAAGSGPIATAASEWVLRRDAGLDAAGRQEFEAWLAEDPRHAEAFARLTSMWSVFDRAAGTGANDAILTRLEIRARQRRRRRRAVAATVAVVALAAGLAGLARRFEWTRPPVAAVAAFEPIRKLPDGSIVELNTGAEIAVQFEDAVRRVALLRGEAHFRVEKDASRPFVVEASGVQVRAVGTAFTVDLSPAAVEVVVTDGRVAVDRVGSPDTPTPASTSAAATTVGAGHHVIVATTTAASEALRVEAMTDAQIEKRLAWRIPRLEFDGMELAQAVKLMNRENRLKIVVGDDAVGRLRVSGVFRTDSPEAFVTIVKQSFGLSATRRGEHEIVLNSAP